MRPLRQVIAGMQAASSANEAARIESRGNDEFAELARGYNAMADAIKQRDSRLVEAEREKGELLHGMYPAGVAERYAAVRKSPQKPSRMLRSQLP